MAKADDFPAQAAVSRRAALAAPAAMLLASGACAAGKSAPSGRTLVAWFTRSGNTTVIARLLGRDLKAELFEIQAAEPYPADYEQTVARARRERDAGVEPPLAGDAPALAGYDTLFLGFPIWGETAPPVIRSFLRRHDLTGKVLRPFITHGGFGPGSSLAVLRSHAPGSRILDPFVLEADQERRTITQTRTWLSAAPTTTAP